MPRQTSQAARRFGYVLAGIFDAALLYVVHIWPGWQAVPFLTEETTEVLGIVTAAIVVGLLANAIYVGFDPPWLRAAGDLVTTAVGLMAMIVIWQVFPFDLGGYAFDWELVTRILLVVGIAGSAIGVLVAAGRLVRAAVVHDVHNGHRV